MNGSTFKMVKKNWVLYSWQKPVEFFVSWHGWGQESGGIEKFIDHLYSEWKHLQENGEMLFLEKNRHQRFYFGA